MMKYHLERTIRARSSSIALTLLCAMLAVTSFAAATRRPKSKSGSKATAKAQPRPPKAKAAGAAALLALAQRELDANHLESAAEYASRAAKEAPELDDYANYVRA